MSERKSIIEVGIDDDAVNSIEDLERDILARDIHRQAAKKYPYVLEYYVDIYI